MKHGEGGARHKECQPDLEAHFADGAWYDINLLAHDATKKRFLVQVLPVTLERGFNSVAHPDTREGRDGSANAHGRVLKVFCSILPAPAFLAVSTLTVRIPAVA